MAPSRPPLPREIASKLTEAAASDRLFVPTIALAEIRQGICNLRRKGADARADILDAWSTALRRIHGRRVLPFGIEEADAAGEIADMAVAAGRHPGFADIAIAGIAKANGLAIVTENLRHFKPLGVASYDLAGLP